MVDLNVFFNKMLAVRSSYDKIKLNILGQVASQVIIMGENLSQLRIEYSYRNKDEYVDCLVLETKTNEVLRDLSINANCEHSGSYESGIECQVFVSFVIEK